MATTDPDRTMTVGDMYPPLRMSAKDEFGNLVPLQDATSMECIAIGSGLHEFSGPASVINPPLVDADGDEWNAQYPFEAGDTDVPDTYRVELKVTWPGGLPQTFRQQSLLIEAP